MDINNIYINPVDDDSVIKWSSAPMVKIHIEWDTFIELESRKYLYEDLYSILRRKYGLKDDYLVEDGDKIVGKFITLKESNVYYRIEGAIFNYGNSLFYFFTFHCNNLCYYYKKKIV
jgi:hypothetical protein